MTSADPAPPPPDVKDWTWTLQRPCPDCGFEAAAVPRDAIAEQVRDSAARWSGVLSRESARERPAPTVWSALEYACHVRDVHVLFRQRLRLMLDEDSPHFPNWDQDETALAGRYWEQDPSTVAGEVARSGEALATAYEQVGPTQWDRRGLRSDGSVFTVETLGQYLLHDLRHHLWDVGSAGQEDDGKKSR